jgi:hypothetical protein
VLTFYQCALPTFEGLFDDRTDDAVQDMLFWLNVWYGTAAMRLHTDETRTLLDDARKALGRAMRVFADEICPQFSTTALPKEVAARKRQQARDAQKKAHLATTERGSKGKAKATGNNADANEDDISKVFTLDFPKLHSLGYYGMDIVRFGALDGVSTTPVSRTPRTLFH